MSWYHHSICYDTCSQRDYSRTVHSYNYGVSSLIDPYNINVDKPSHASHDTITVFTGIWLQFTTIVAQYVSICYDVLHTSWYQENQNRVQIHRTPFLWGQVSFLKYKQPHTILVELILASHWHTMVHSITQHSITQQHDHVCVCVGEFKCYHCKQCIVKVFYDSREL